MPNVTFNTQKKSFYSSLHKKVEIYFKDRRINKTGDHRLFIKAFLLIFSAGLLYVLLLTVRLHPAAGLILCGLMGFLLATIGFNVMHDANHGSFSGKRWVNEALSLTANLMGVNAWLWRQKHNLIHHTFTNLDGVDEDLATTSLLRMGPYQKKYRVHRYQAFYCIPVYGLTSLMWTFFSDFKKYFTRKIQVTALPEMSSGEHLLFWFSKILYAFLFIGLPVYLLGFLPFLAGFLAMHLVLGITLAVVFQLAHVVEATHFEDAHKEDLHIGQEWAVHQVRTTADFATGNPVISWLTGGLNFQVEHHLFPRISHIHYPVIQRMVKETCADFGIRYNGYPTMWAAFRSHLRLMKRLGIQ
jgi:linoleoyl-CoA desaturase